MDTLLAIITIAFVIAVAVVVAWAFFEMSPFATHGDHFRDRYGHRRGESPHLE